MLKKIGFTSKILCYVKDEGTNLGTMTTTLKSIISCKHSTCLPHFDAPPHSLKDSNVSPKVETTKEKGIRVHSLTRNTSKVERRVGALGWGRGLGRVISESITHMNLHKPNNKLVSAWLEHF